MMESRLNTSAASGLDHEHMALQADQQAKSAFFERLPAEIRRMIYVEFWKLSGSLKRHIVVQPQITSTYMENHISSSSCVLEDQNGPDSRYEAYKASALLEAAGTGDWRRDWIRRIDSNWSLHWKCEERRARQLRRPQASWSPFLNVLSTCRLMYVVHFYPLPHSFRAGLIVRQVSGSPTLPLYNPDFCVHRHTDSNIFHNLLPSLHLPSSRNLHPFPSRPNRTILSCPPPSRPPSFYSGLLGQRRLSFPQSLVSILRRPRGLHPPPDSQFGLRYPGLTGLEGQGL